jgi:hypothetical protein
MTQQVARRRIIVPVYLAVKDVKLPTDKSFFLIAENGPFVHRVSPNGLFKGLYRCGYDDVPGLIQVTHCLHTEQGPIFFRKTKEEKETAWASTWWKKKEEEKETLDIVDVDTGELAETGLMYVEPYISMNLPKLDAKTVLYPALLWFRTVYRKHRSEAIVIIGYNIESGEYKLFCPKQDVTGGGINYNRQFNEYIPNPWKPVGSIHSHPGFNAYHSGTDTHDEQSFDGVHLTFGHVSERSFSLASSLVMGAGGEYDYREQVEPENVCVGLRRIGNRNALTSKWMSSSQQNFFQIDLTADEKKEIKTFYDKELEPEWIKLVEHRTYGGFFGGIGGVGLGNGKDDDFELEDSPESSIWYRDEDAATKDIPPS